MISLLIRVGIFLVTRRWGLIILGTLLVLSGLIVGLSSHHSTYQTIDQGTFTPYVVDDGNDYIQQDNSSTYYIIHESDFTPAFNGSQVFKKNTNTFAFLAEHDAQSVDVKLVDGTLINGTGYQVEKITLFDSNRQQTQQYISNEYKQNPSGYNKNNWSTGSGLILVGIVLAGLSFFVRRKKLVQKSTDFSAAPSAAMGMQGQGQPNTNPNGTSYQQPTLYQPPNPYQQPYQGPAQFPSFTPPPGSYDKTQLANPFDQPPQQ